MSNFVRNFLDKYVDNSNYRRKKRILSQSIRKSKQCIAETLYQRRCRKRTAHTHKCWIRLAKQDNLPFLTLGYYQRGQGVI
jgi:hypothetical protein